MGIDRGQRALGKFSQAETQRRRIAAVGQDGAELDDATKALLERAKAKRSGQPMALPESRRRQVTLPPRSQPEPEAEESKSSTPAKAKKSATRSRKSK